MVRHRGGRCAALALGLATIAAACSDDEGGNGAAPSDSSTPAGASTTAAGTPGTVAMTLTIDLNPDAVWDDGTPITFADIDCTYRATMHTPQSISTTGYDQIVDLRQGSSDKQVIIDFATRYGPYKTLFPTIIKAAGVANCDDVSQEMQTGIPFSGREWKLESWSDTQAILVPNEAYWNPARAPKVDQLVIVPLEDSDTEVTALVSGTVDFIYPQFFQGIDAALDVPDVEVALTVGTQYEGLFFQQASGPFADPVFRAAFSQSVDRAELFQQVYAPLMSGAQLLECGGWVPTIGQWCDQTAFAGGYDPAGAVQLLDGAGWERTTDGLWAKDGVVPRVRFMVNSGSDRRKGAQDFLIPRLRSAGFDVVADNCDSDCVFQQRLPHLDYDLGLYILATQPDPTVTHLYSCSAVSSEANNYAGQNYTGWCSAEASELMAAADEAVDEAERVELTHRIAHLMADDHVMLPLFQFPLSGAYRTDRIGGPVTAELANYRAFDNTAQWEDIDGDGRIVIGASQWPGCLNPINECASSAWAAWTATFPTLPAIWDTTDDGTFEPTDLVVGEPTVEVVDEDG